MPWVRIKRAMAGVMDPTVWAYHFRDLTLKEVDGDTLVVGLPSPSLEATQRLRPHIEQAVKGQYGLSLVFVAA